MKNTKKNLRQNRKSKNISMYKNIYVNIWIDTRKSYSGPWVTSSSKKTAEKNKGICTSRRDKETTGDSQKTQGFFSKNAPLTGLSRTKDVEAMASSIPSYAVARSGPETFSRNLWRNVKRNMLILAATPSNVLQDMLIPEGTTGASDFNNLLSSLPSRVNVTPEIFSSQDVLPEGWTSGVDPTSNRIYYINHNTRETQWEPPQNAGAAGRKRKQSNKKNKILNKSQRSKKK